jgi:membrane protein DedA with SNARE-associated domain
MSLESLIQTYGYYALLVGTFFEGETILIIAGFAVHQGYLELPWVIVFAFLGSMAGDQTFFFIGRFRGRKFLEKRPHWQARTAKVETLIERYQAKLILSFRFMYGLRSVIPFAFGMSGVKSEVFIILNAVSALLWAAVVGTGGFFFGSALEAVIGEIKRYELAVILLLAFAGASMWLVCYWRKSAGKSGPGQPGPNTGSSSS